MRVDEERTYLRGAEWQLRMLLYKLTSKVIVKSKLLMLVLWGLGNDWLRQTLL
jgi:hypothetical protein